MGGGGGGAFRDWHAQSFKYSWEWGTRGGWGWGGQYYFVVLHVIL